MFAAGIGVGLLAMIALLASEALPVIVVAAALWTAGSQAMQVVLAPYLTEHSDRSHRNELFAIQFAIQQVTNIIAAVLGGVVAGLIARALGLDPAGSGVYRIILVIMALLMAAAMLTVTRLSDDRPRVAADRRVRRLGEPAAFPPDPRRSRTWLGIRVHDRGLFAKLLIPGLLISIGAGQVIPFLNLYVQRKFGLDLTSAQRRVRADLARDHRRDPVPAAAGAAVRPDHLGRDRAGREHPVPRRARVLARAVDGDPRDGRPELADERGQPDLQRVRDGAGHARASGRRCRRR